MNAKKWMWTLVVLPILVLNASWLISMKSVFSCETEIKMNQWWNVKRMKWINCHKHTRARARTRAWDVWVYEKSYADADVMLLKCVRVCMGVHMREISSTQTKCRIAARVCACQKNTPTQLTCGSPAVSPIHTHIELYTNKAIDGWTENEHTSTLAVP